MTESIGWVLVGDEGVVLDCDERFCASMRASRDDIVAAGILSVTAPADHARCIDLYRKIKRDGQPFTTVKRIIRADCSHLWVKIVGSSPSWTPVSSDIHIHVTACPAPAGWVDPHLLLVAARSMARTHRMRIKSFGATMFGDRSWEILLAAYIGEAEGRVLTTASLHADLGLSVVSASRWLRVLSAEGLIECEERAYSALITSSIRLTSAAHDRFERFLSRAYREHADAVSELQ